MIQHSGRLNKVHRVFDPYKDRTGYVRLDRNEDPIGYDQGFFQTWKDQLTVDDVAAYADSFLLTEKLANWLNIKPENIYIGAGSDALIKNIFEVYIDAGDTILMQKPSWRMYDVYADIYGAQCEFITYDQDFQIEPEEILDKLKKENIKMLVLANPNQPTGNIIEPEILHEIINLAHERGTIVLMDEAYYLFTENTAIEHIQNFENLIVVRTFSKAFGLAGLRLGYIVAQLKRIQELMLVRPVTDGNSLALNFACYILDNMDIALQKIQESNKGRDYLCEQLNQSGIFCRPSQTNFLMLECPDEETANALISFAKSKKYMLKGPFKGDPVNNYIRITTGPLNLMQQFWEDCREGFIEHLTTTGIKAAS